MSYECLALITSTLTLIATLVMALATWTISKTNKDQLQALIFSERYKIYSEIKDYVVFTIVTQYHDSYSETEKINMLKNYRLNVIKCSYIFGKAVHDHLKKFDMLLMDVVNPEMEEVINKIAQKELEKFIRNGDFDKPFTQFLSFPGVE